MRKETASELLIDYSADDLLDIVSGLMLDDPFEEYEGKCSSGGGSSGNGGSCAGGSGGCNGGSCGSGGTGGGSGRG